MKKTLKDRSVPLALALLCILSFGLLIPWLGFFQDDWVIMWLARAYPPQVLIQSFAHERPFFAAIYFVTTRLIGDQPLAWHIFGLFTRWLCVLALWWALGMIWPRQRQQVTWIAFIFAIYPSFKEQVLPVSFSQLFILLAAIFFSFGAMTWAIRRPAWRWPLTAVSLLASSFSLFSAEYFFGMELLRPLLLWFVLDQPEQTWGQRLKRTLSRWAPYLAVLFLFLFWRLFIFKFPTYGPRLAEQWLADPRATVVQMVQTVIQDAFVVVIFAWVQTLDFVKTISPAMTPIVVRWGIILLLTSATAWYLLKLLANADSTTADPSAQKHWSRQALMLGFASLLLVGWPYWFTGLPVSLEMSNDRFTLAFMFGVSILIVGLIDWLVKTDTQKVWLVAIMVGLATGLHYQTAQTFRDLHDTQATFFRQLSWRAPDLRPDTLILADNQGFPYSGSNSMAAVVNWIYSPHSQAPRMDYQWFFLADKLGEGLPDLQPGRSIEVPIYPLTFKGSTSQALVIDFTPNACLQVIQPGVQDDFPHRAALIEQAAPLSNIDRILPQSQQTPAQITAIFGAASTTNWCYYFEKADLARQNGDWPAIVALANEANRQGLRPAPKNEMEYLPFIEGYAHQNEWQKASSLTRKAINAIPALKTSLCAAWTRVASTTVASPERQATLANNSQVLGCSLP